MVNYYWHRYNANAVYNYSTERQAKYMSELYSSGKYFWVVPTLNIVNGVFDKSKGHSVHVTRLVSGDYQSNGYTSNIFGTTTAFVLLSDTEAKNNNHSRAEHDGDYIYNRMSNNDSSYVVKSVFSHYTKGAYVTTVQADYSAYTNNARNADGYWYVRDAIVNTAPTWNAIPTQTVRKNTTANVNLNSYVWDAEGNALTYSASSSNTAVATVSISGGTLTVRGMAIGTATITVTANDGNGGVTSTTFTVTVANTVPVGTTIPNQTTKKSSTVDVNLANYFSDADNDALTFTASSANTNIATVSVSGSTLTITGVSIGTSLITVTANDSKATASQSFTTTVTNSVPTVAVTAPSMNMTLYENDLFNLAGQAADVDANQSVTVYAQTNNEQRIVLGVGLSNAPVTFNKVLKFKSGQLYDGETPVTGNLTDGVAHTLKIWAQDGDGAQSAITERTFYVVPNRPPILTVDTVVPSGIINTDKFKISGTAGDPDGNSVTASYRINGGNSVALEIIEGRWEFDIALVQLNVGENTIVIELSDSYNFKVSKTLKLNKNEVKTPILHSVARYKIEPPRGSATGVLLYLQRDEDLTDLKVELSMTIAGEQEHYETLTSDNTAPVSQGVVEDEFYFEADEAKNQIILKLSTTRPNISVDKKIHLISGVLE